MKRFTTGILSSMLLSTLTIVPVAKAQTIEVTPAQLVFLAKDGYFENQGIPKGGTLISEYELGRITSKDLIQAAINDKRVTADALNNRGYMHAVIEEMRNLVQYN